MKDEPEECKEKEQEGIKYALCPGTFQQRQDNSGRSKEKKKKTNMVYGE